MEKLVRYVARSERIRGKSSVPFSNALRTMMTAGTRLRAKQVATRLMSPLARRRARSSIDRDGPLRLNLGSGPNHLPGWVNVDLVGAKAPIVWDIRHPLPFPDQSADAVFVEHVFEHLPYSDVLSVLRQIYPVLKDNGVLRVGVPDAGLYAKNYHDDPEDIIENLRPGRPTRMLALREVFQEHGHVTAWDAETLLLFLDAAGFDDAHVAPAAASRLDPAPDSSENIPESVYVECLKRRALPAATRPTVGARSQ